MDSSSRSLLFIAVVNVDNVVVVPELVSSVGGSILPVGVGGIVGVGSSKGHSGRAAALIGLEEGQVVAGGLDNSCRMLVLR
jgi:hypothetical protein